MSKHGGIEPGSLHGGRGEFGPREPAQDPDTAFWAKIREMDAGEMRKWLKTPANRQEFEAAESRKRNRT